MTPLPIVFVAGAGMDHTVWRFQSRWLESRGHPVGLADLPGHGPASGKPLQSAKEMGAWLSEWVSDFAHGRSAVLAGHSLGSLVCIESAVGNPAVAGLVLVGTGSGMPVHPDLMTASRVDLARAARLIAGWSFPVAHRGAHPEPGTWQAGATERMVANSSPGVLAADLAASESYDVMARAPELAVPTLIVAGSDDRMVSARSARVLAGVIPGSRLVVLDGLGHEPMSQDPPTFNRLLADFLATLPGPTSD